MATDLRSVSDTTFNLYLYPIVAWASGLLLLYSQGWLRFGLALCYPLAAWYAALSGVWLVQAQRRHRAGQLDRDEVAAGARSLGKVLSLVSLCPALVFLADDPFAAAAWSAGAGVGLVALLSYGFVEGVTRFEHGLASGFALAVASLALPINATGALSLATVLGWYSHLTAP